MQINERLAAERERLRLTQTEMAKRLGVAFRTYCDYEAGKSQPKAGTLAAAREIGADVMYILTGEVGESALSLEEANLLARYREASDAVKAAALGALIGGAAPAGVQQTFHSGVNIGQNVTGDVTGSSTFAFGAEKKKK
ncbi:transcriptional regulator [Pandoraea anapnoica]|uniref:Transcriptional regulator n=1 Tax=Pandoraea anapnoica TaxID=2508301 RepID=A0A5E5AD73_9BURK|nr:helix-turn-helix transcriptional regulator [Pandoraea anapnoica]VVE71544.1 transcriptional regulator [Pandoraea anapnoica]